MLFHVPGPELFLRVLRSILKFLTLHKRRKSLCIEPGVWTVAYKKNGKDI